MEGVGGRLGRSSARYGPTSTTVFTGPVRRWKKKWVKIPPVNSNRHNHTASNDTVNGSSHLLLFKWTPHNIDNPNGVVSDEPPKKKFKYIPVVVLEEQKNKPAEQMDDETDNPIDTNAAGPTSKSDDDDGDDDDDNDDDGFDEKPDINDVPVDENQDPENSPVERQDLNVSTLDFNLGLGTPDQGENGYDSTAEQTKDE